MSKEELEPYRLLGDRELDAILRLLKLEGTPLGPTDDFIEMAKRAQQVNKLNRTAAQMEMVSFLSRYNSLPKWVDLDQLRRGQEVFLAYMPAARLSLYYRSLVSGFSISRIAAVIQATGYLAPPSRPDQSLQRLMDTGELIAACIGLGVDSLMPGELGWKAALHVRVLHAKVRFSLLNRKGRRAWNTARYGVPINQEDMAGTLLAFSQHVLDGIDILSGVPLPEQERLDYLALWRYIGWLLGVETEAEAWKGQECEMITPMDPCGPGPTSLHERDTTIRAAAILQSVVAHLLQPDENSVQVAHHLLKITDRRPPSFDTSKIPANFYSNNLFYFRSLQCRRLIGDPLADALELPLHPNSIARFRIWLYSTIALTVIGVYTLIGIVVPFARRRMIRWHAKGLQIYHKQWLKDHPSRMARALVTKQLPTCVELCGDEVEEIPKVNGGTSQSFCPFAMVANPS